MKIEVNINAEELSEIIKKELEPSQKSIEDLLYLVGTLIELRVYSVKEVAEMLKKSPVTIYSYCAAGTIKATPKGRTFMITHQALLDYINPKIKKK